MKDHEVDKELILLIYKNLLRGPLVLSGLRIWHCCCYGSGYSCGMVQFLAQNFHMPMAMAKKKRCYFLSGPDKLGRDDG